VKPKLHLLIGSLHQSVGTHTLAPLEW